MEGLLNKETVETSHIKLDFMKKIFAIILFVFIMRAEVTCQNSIRFFNNWGDTIRVSVKQIDSFTRGFFINNRYFLENLNDSAHYCNVNFGYDEGVLEIHSQPIANYLDSLEILINSNKIILVPFNVIENLAQFENKEISYAQLIPFADYCKESIDTSGQSFFIKSYDFIFKGDSIQKKLFNLEYFSSAIGVIGVNILLEKGQTAWIVKSKINYCNESDKDFHNSTIIKADYDLIIVKNGAHGTCFHSCDNQFYKYVDGMLYKGLDIVEDLFSGCDTTVEIKGKYHVLNDNEIEVTFDFKKTLNEIVDDRYKETSVLKNQQYTVIYKWNVNLKKYKLVSIPTSILKELLDWQN